MRISRFLAVAAALVFTGTAAHAAPLKVGVSAGPYGEILDFAGKIAAKEGLEVKVVEFTDYIGPDAALAQGDIDVNNYQHRPFLANINKTRGYDLVEGPTSIVVPLGIYSNKAKTITEIPEGGSVAIPNDPSNGARALFLLSKAGLLTLRDGADVNATIADITDNPKKLKIIELDAAQLPRSLDDTQASAVPLNYAVLAGLDPKKSLFIEDETSKWTLVWATRRDNAGDPRVKRYIDIYRSDEVKRFILTRFNGTILPTW